MTANLTPKARAINDFRSSSGKGKSIAADRRVGNPECRQGGSQVSLDYFSRITGHLCFIVVSARVLQYSPMGDLSAIGLG
jgi:hypothetical protein